MPTSQVLNPLKGVSLYPASRSVHQIVEGNLMLHLHRPIHWSATMQLGALTLHPSWPSVPGQERSCFRCANTCLPAYQKGTIPPNPQQCLRASFGCLAALSIQCNAVSLRQPYLLRTDASVLSLPQVPRHVCSIAQNNQEVKRHTRWIQALGAFGAVCALVR